MRKYCNNCNENYSEDFKFCPKCGQLLEKKLSEVAEKYKDIYGYWIVTTEGDCEGRTTKTLGTFKGYIDDIALSLANKCYYSLCFTKIKEPTEEKYTDTENNSLFYKDMIKKIAYVLQYKNFNAEINKIIFVLKTVFHLNF